MPRPLTTREADVLRYVAQGLSTHNIAQALRCAESTVHATRSRIIRALGARSIDHAIQIHNQPNQREASPMSTQPRLFHLQRDTDITGVSGTGTVAHGVQWPDGTVTIRWAGDRPSTVQWASIDDAEAVHGHGGHTRIIWADAPFLMLASRPTEGTAQ
ncbi:LuxR C-terminal-related transcriptional regulator [Kitasatospora sp. NPDC003701]